MMQLCEALTMLGVDVEPTWTRSVWDVYGIDHRFRLSMVPAPLRQQSMDGRLGQLIVLFYRLVVYPFCAYRAHRRPRADGSRPPRTVFYSRNYACIASVLPLRKVLGNRARTVLEIHVPPSGRLRTKLLRLIDGVACNSVSLHTMMLQKNLLSEKNSIGRHAGFSPELTERNRLSRSDARDRLGWEASERVACYTGKMYWGSGEIELLVAAAELLASECVRFVIVGGRADHVELWRAEIVRRGLTNVQFPGFVAPSDVFVYQMAADVLLLYYESGLALNDFRSPGKLFEYMASGTPAVVADYPSIREVVRDGENGLLVPPDRPDLLAVAVAKILRDPALAQRLAAQAAADAMLHTWTATAEATLSLVDRLWGE
jgi:glycosyltransferase involved in cell wall biosynthesis